MGKRFGRNQKRAMRSQIQNQAELIKRNEYAFNSLNADLHEANNIINFTAEVLGQHFVSLPVKTKEVKEILSHYEYYIERPIGIGADWHRPIRSFVDTALSRIDVYHAEVEADELRGMIQMRYTSRCGAVGYGLSQHAWRNLSENQLIELVKAQIAPKMATLLVRDMKEAVKRWSV